MGLVLCVRSWGWVVVGGLDEWGERERERVTLAYGFRVLCFRSDDVRFSIVISHKVFQTEKPC
jgi:hypothetical protein